MFTPKFSWLIVASGVLISMSMIAYVGPNVRRRWRWVTPGHVLGMLAAGDSPETILEGYPWLQREDILACLLYAQRLVGHERVEPFLASA